MPYKLTLLGCAADAHFYFQDHAHSAFLSQLAEKARANLPKHPENRKNVQEVAHELGAKCC